MTTSPGKSWRSTVVCSVIFGFLFSQGLLLCQYDFHRLNCMWHSMWSLFKEQSHCWCSHWLGKMRAWESWKNLSESWKSPGNLFLKKGANPENEMVNLRKFGETHIYWPLKTLCWHPAFKSCLEHCHKVTSTQHSLSWHFHCSSLSLKLVTQTMYGSLGVLLVLYYSCGCFMPQKCARNCSTHHACVLPDWFECDLINNVHSFTVAYIPGVQWIKVM